MAQRSLEDLLQTVNPVELLRNSQEGAYVYPVQRHETPRVTKAA